MPSHTLPKVVFWNNQPTPYVVTWFNALAQSPVLDFEAWFDVEREVGRDWDVNPGSWLFKYRYVSGRQVGKHALTIPIDELRSIRPDVFVQALDNGRAAVGAAIGRAYAGRLALKVEPSMKARSWRAPLREVVKRIVGHAIDGAAVSGPDSADWIASYGLPKERIWWTRQGIDVSHFGKFRDVSEETRAAWRKQLGLHGTAFIYVGRLLALKGLSTLLEAFNLLITDGLDVSLLIVGSGAEEAAIRQAMSATRDVFLVGHQQPSELPQFYAAADVFVFPTLGDSHGMVIEEAMAAGLPVISTTSVGNVRYRVKPGENGTLVEPGSAESLAFAMRDLALADDATRGALRSGALAHAQSLGPEIYANDFGRFITELLRLSPRRTLASRLLYIFGRSVAASWGYLGPRQ